ncbi:MAG: methyltransferase domain-containing protein [Planctomycetota bacterium]
MADVGTGSGCIAVTLAAQVPDAIVVASDIVAEALELARRNAVRHGVADRIELVEGSLAEPLAARVGREGRRFDAICANLPYIPRFETASMEAAVREHVPPSAWDGGEDGLRLVAPFIAAAAPLLAEGGLLALEIAHAHRDEALRLAGAAGLAGATVLKDQDDLWRVLVAERPAAAAGPPGPPDHE